MDPTATASTRRMGRTIGRGLVTLWAVFWMWFGIASGIGEGGGEYLLGHLLFPALFVLLSALIPWKFEYVGAIILIIEGLVLLIGYPLVGRQFPLATIIFVEASLSLPPLLGGILLFIDSRSSLSVSPAHQS